jgi:hypothetical protein
MYALCKKKPKWKHHAFTVFRLYEYESIRTNTGILVHWVTTKKEGTSGVLKIESSIYSFRDDIFFDFFIPISFD